MKKLKLNLERLNNVEVLTRSQLKNVLGGAALTTTGSGCDENPFGKFCINRADCAYWCDGQFWDGYCFYSKCTHP